MVQAIPGTLIKAPSFSSPESKPRTAEDQARRSQVPSLPVVNMNHMNYSISGNLAKRRASSIRDPIFQDFR